MYNSNEMEECYLIKSGVFEQKILDEDKIETYYELIRDNEIDENFKDTIRNFLIPFKISPLKFMLNNEFYGKPYVADFRHQHKHIAPSLRKIKDNPFEMALGYPSWFLSAFSDVALWAQRGGSGFELIKNRYEYLSEEDLSDGKYIRANILNEIILLYQKKTNKTFECKKY